VPVRALPTTTWTCCDAITIQNGHCVDIHEGDRMQVVGPSSSLLSDHDGFEGDPDPPCFRRILHNWTCVGRLEHVG
jgi:hypothetical protein